MGDVEPPPDASTEDCLRVLEALAADGVPVVVLAGGEPALRADLPELIVAGRRLGLAVGLITNGSCVTPAVLAAAEAHADWVMCSPHVPQELRGPRPERAFEDAWAGFDRMRRSLRRPFLGCAITLSKLTAPRLDELIGRALSAGADGVKVQPVFAPELFPDQERVVLAVKSLLRWTRLAPGRMQVPSFFLERLPAFFGPEPAVPCTVARNFHVGVYPDGTVSACCPERKIRGNLLDGSVDFDGPIPPLEQCYGCQRLDILTSLRLCGEARAQRP